MKNQLYRISAGYSGECNVDTYVERTRFSKMTKVLTDIHLRISPTITFQIDTLIITEQFVLIVEVKNLADTVRFVQNPPHLMQERKTGDEAVIDCPIYQLEANKSNLDEWLRQRGIHLNTRGLLVLANPNTMVKDAPSDFPIIYKKQIPYYLQNIPSSERVISTGQFHKIIRKIQEEQQQFNPYPLCSYFDIDPSDLRPGLLCRYCNGQLHRKNRETWHCTGCEKEAENPYNDGISDWLSLVKKSMSNAECRSFLGLKDKHAAYYVLKNSPLVQKGKSIATFYISSRKKG